MAQIKDRIALFNTLTLGRQFVAAVVMPVLFGAFTGLALVWSAPLYYGFLVVAVVGGIAAGFEHKLLKGGLYRGLSGALLFTASILLALLCTGLEPRAELPEPAALLFPINAVFGVIFGFLGAWLRYRASK